MGGYFSKKVSVKDELVRVTEDILRLRGDIEKIQSSQATIIRSTFFMIFLLSTTGSAYLFMLVNDKRKWGLYSLLVFIASTLVFILLHKCIRPLYEWRIDKKQKKLVELVDEKQKIIEEIKDKESYKVASELLQEFGDEDETTMYGTPIHNTSVMNKTFAKNNSTFIERSKNGANPMKKPQSRFNTPNMDSKALQIKAAQNMSNKRQIDVPGPMQKSISSHSSINRINDVSRSLPPRPYIDNHNTSIVERIADMVLGDGINNRYALICLFCKSHNGMALKDEFEGLAYKCYKCQKFNPARSDKEKYEECVKRSKSEDNILSEESNENVLQPLNTNRVIKNKN
uniref:Endoplasmic reticulum junction formation protein lunapark n=1 Tax=Parastrongyloides trichosuri TaxID=131310 RepID=A0A0N4Z664_PARTI